MLGRNLLHRLALLRRQRGDLRLLGGAFFRFGRRELDADRLHLGIGRDETIDHVLGERDLVHVLGELVERRRVEAAIGLGQGRGN